MHRAPLTIVIFISIVSILVPTLLLPQYTYAQVNECTDGKDNNGDGKIDLGQDTDYDGIVDTTERAATADPICNKTKGQCETARCESSLQTTAQYNPNVTLGSGKDFNGISFSGVGGAIAGCTNAGKWAVKGLTGLFSKKLTDDEKLQKDIQGLLNTEKNSNVPTTDSAAQQKIEDAKKELNRMNNTTECLNGVAYAVAKNLLQQVISKELNFVNTGLGGNSLYLKDAAAYYRNISTDKISEYTSTIQTKNPIFGNALRSAINRQATGLNDGLSNAVMNTPEAQQFNDFQNDFTNGGWGAWLSTTQNDNNNPVGAMLNSSDELQRSIDTQIQNTRDELQWSGGFFNMKKCLETSKTEKDSKTGDAKCIKDESVTPGKIIADQTSRVVQSPIVQLELADGINEVLGAWTDRMLNNLLAKGLSALQGAGYASVATDTNGNTIASNATVTGNTLGYTSVTGSYNVGDFDISRPQYLYAIIRAQKNYLNQVLDSQTAIQSVVPQTAALDYCLPGPNPTWSDSIDANFNLFVNNMDETTEENLAEKTRDFFSKLPGNKILSSALGFIDGLFHITDKNSNIYFVNSNLSLTDRTTGQILPVSSTLYTMKNRENHKDVIIGKFESAFSAIKGYINNEFGISHVADAFEKSENLPNHILDSTDGAVGAADARAKTISAYAEAANLIAYDKGVQDVETEYATTVDTVSASVAELESIRVDVNKIVKKARDRYVKERADAGNPIASTIDSTTGAPMLCIDQAYIINNSPITGNPRVESSVPSRADINFSQQSSDYFYRTLPFTNI